MGVQESDSSELKSITEENNQDDRQVNFDADSNSVAKEFAGSLDQAQAVLCQSIIRSQLQSEEYKDAMRLTFETRARVQSILSRFLLDHPIGQSLVHAGLFAHPVTKEEIKHEEKVRTLAKLIEETSPQVSWEEAELTAMLEPDLLPRRPEIIVLETIVDTYSKIRAVTTEDYDPNINIDYLFGFNFNEMLSKAPFVSKEDREVLLPLFPKVLMERKAAHLRDRFLKLLGDKDWYGFLELLHSQYRSPQFGEQLQYWVFERRHYIFPNKHFRRNLFRKMMLILIEEGQTEFERFDKFWQDAGLDFSDPKEITRLTKKAFPRDQWQDLLQEEPHRYFKLQAILASYGIYP